MDKTEYFEYLDELRESGVTNMFGAAPYLVSEFGIMVSYIMAEITHYRKGHDVYEWTKKLANWMNRK